MSHRHPGIFDVGNLFAGEATRGRNERRRCPKYCPLLAGACLLACVTTTERENKELSKILPTSCGFSHEERGKCVESPM